MPIERKNIMADIKNVTSVWMDSVRCQEDHKTIFKPAKSAYRRLQQLNDNSTIFVCEQLQKSLTSSAASSSSTSQICEIVRHWLLRSAGKSKMRNKVTLVALIVLSSIGKTRISHRRLSQRDTVVEAQSWYGVLSRTGEQVVQGSQDAARYIGMLERSSLFT